MVCYTTFLMTGNTRLCKSITVGTIKKYILAVNNYFIDNNQWDPLITKQGKYPLFSNQFAEKLNAGNLCQTVKSLSL